MIGLVRATVICATLALGLTAAGAADKAFKRDDLADAADQAGGPDQERGGTGRQNSPRRCATTPMPPSSATISAPACRSSARSRRSRRMTAPTGCGSPRPSSRSGRPVPASRPSCSSAPRPRPISPISAPATGPRRRMRSPCWAGRCPTASCGVRRCDTLAAVARPARGRRGARPVRADARRARLPAARLHRRFRCGLAARLLPVLRGPRQARRLRAVRGAGRHRQAGADLRGQAALRRRSQARRALQHQPARRACRRR